MWRVKDDQASLDVGGLTARVSLSDPSQGLSEIQFGDTAIHPARLLRLRQFSATSQQESPDSYVRGLDLVATYGRDDLRGLHRQVDWKLIHHPDLSVAGLEMVVSIHTDLLEDDVTLHVDSDPPSVESFCLVDVVAGSYLAIQEAVLSATAESRGAGLFLHRLANEAGSYVEIVHPADFTTAQIKRDPNEAARVETTFPLFAEQLEKGVIRRARVQALFLPSDNDQATAVECYRRFIDSPPPLTV